MTDRHGPQDLPGLEGQSTEEITAGWSDQAWESWFRETVEPSDRWRTLLESYNIDEGFGDDNDAAEARFARNDDSGEPDPDLLAGIKSLDALIDDGFMGFISWTRVAQGWDASHERAATEGDVSSLAAEFARLSTESRQRFFEGWYRVHEDAVPADPAPADSIVDELTPGAGLGRNWRLWAIPVVIGGIIVLWIWAGGSGSEDEAREALQGEPTVTTAAESDPEPTTTLPAGTLPEERRVSGRGVVTEAYTADDRPRIETALSEVRVTLGASCQGGTILISSGSLSEGPSGHFYPDGFGGFVWDDNTRHDSEDGVQLVDADEVSGVTLADGTLSFEWTRTNFDGSTWTVPISLPAPEGAEDWWAELGAAGPAPYTAEYQAEEQDGSLVVTGTTDAPDGTVFEVVAASGDRFPVEVVDGVFQVTVPGATGSGGSSVQVFDGAHVLGCSTG